MALKSQIRQTFEDRRNETDPEAIEAYKRESVASDGAARNRRWLT